MKLSKLLLKLFSYDNFKNEENKTRVLGILIILILLWSVLYFIPEFFILLFNTLLGNLILIVTALLVFMNNRLYGLLISLLFLLLFRFSLLSRKEAFTQDSKMDFLKIQNTINKQTVFDMNVIEKQATQEELDYFNQNGRWPWSQKVVELYEEAVRNNPYVRTIPELSTDYARKTYNEAAILRILSYQTKEGQFLLNGILVNDKSKPNMSEELPSGFGEFAYSSGLTENRTYDIIKCNLKDDSNPSLERITYNGKGAVYGEQTQKVTPIDYNNLENIIPGFSFINSPCNPCKSMTAIPDYSCAFKLNLKNKSPFVSTVWQYLWGTNDNPLET